MTLVSHAGSVSPSVRGGAPRSPQTDACKLSGIVGSRVATRTALTTTSLGTSPSASSRSLKGLVADLQPQCRRRRRFRPSRPDVCATPNSQQPSVADQPCRAGTPSASRAQRRTTTAERPTTRSPAATSRPSSTIKQSTRNTPRSTRGTSP